MLTTPLGTSDVASTSASVIAANGRLRRDHHGCIAADDRRREPEDEPFEPGSGATTPATPIGSGIVKLK